MIPRELPWPPSCFRMKLFNIDHHFAAIWNLYRHLTSTYMAMAISSTAYSLSSVSLSLSFSYTLSSWLNTQKNTLITIINHPSMNREISQSSHSLKVSHKNKHFTSSVLRHRFEKTQKAICERRKNINKEVSSFVCVCLLFATKRTTRERASYTPAEYAVKTTRRLVDSRRGEMYQEQSRAERSGAVARYNCRLMYRSLSCSL